MDTYDSINEVFEKNAPFPKLGMSSLSGFQGNTKVAKTKDWIVVSDPGKSLEDRLKALEKDISSLKEDVSSLKEDASSMMKVSCILSHPIINDVAARILLSAVAPQVQKSNFFSKLAEKNDSKMLHLTRNLSPAEITVESFAAVADDIISRGDNNGGYGLDQSLDQYVIEARAVIQLHPSIKSKHPQECSIIDNYELIKSTFNF